MATTKTRASIDNGLQTDVDSVKNSKKISNNLSNYVLELAKPTTKVEPQATKPSVSHRVE